MNSDDDGDFQPLWFAKFFSHIETIPPRKIVKYSDAQMAPRIRVGSLRFGSLVSYRTGEQARFKDADEGNMSLVINTNGIFRGGIIHPTLTAAPGMPVSLENVWLAEDIAANVLCVTSGSYSRKHHRRMIAINPDLTHYTEFAFDKLFVALAACFDGMPFHKGDRALLARRVIYGERSRKADLGDGRELYIYGDMERLKHEMITTYTKPKAFEHESELRFVLRNTPPECLDAKGALIVQSPAIVEAISGMGTI